MLCFYFYTIQQNVIASLSWKYLLFSYNTELYTWSNNLNSFSFKFRWDRYNAEFKNSLTKAFYNTVNVIFWIYLLIYHSSNQAQNSLKQNLTNNLWFKLYLLSIQHFSRNSDNNKPVVFIYKSLCSCSTLYNLFPIFSTNTRERNLGESLEQTR